MTTPKSGLDRRTLLKGMGLAAGAAGLGLDMRFAHAQDTDGPRFLIVFAASGGASILDGPLAIRASESRNASTLNTFADPLVQSFDGLPFRAVDQRRESLGQIPQAFTSTHSDFIRRHGRDMMVATWTRTSVNHTIGQRRSVTGNEAWNGRTLQELVALQYGAQHPLPNVHLMSGSGYTELGTDRSLPSYCYGEVVADPGLWPLALDGSKGLPDAPSASLLAKARGVRNDVLDRRSTFSKVFGQSPKLEHWRQIRAEKQQAIEARDLVSKLMFQTDSARYPLRAFGLSESPLASKVREAFPRFEKDPLEAQAALAFLLIKYGVSVTVTLGPSGAFIYDGDQGGIGRGGLPEDSVINPPIAFDFSHNGHRSVQALMWQRLYQLADGLIGLLKSEEFGNGQSYWDRSAIYFATDFDRERTRPENSDDWGTGHHLSNGVVLLSPLVNGGKILGGVDPHSGLTYGFDPMTGTPDTGREMAEAEIFSGILGAMQVETTGSGLPPVPAMRKA